MFSIINNLPEVDGASVLVCVTSVVVVAGASVVVVIAA